MRSTIQWRYPITYTNTGFECDDIPSIIRNETTTQQGRSVKRIEGRIAFLEAKIQVHHMAVRRAFQEVPTLVNQIRGMHRLGLDKEDNIQRSMTKQATNATIRNNAKKKIAKNQADFAMWKAQQMNDSDEQDGDENLGAVNGPDDLADAATEEQCAKMEQAQYANADANADANVDDPNADDEFEEEKVGALTNEEDAELLYLEKCLRKRPSAQINRTPQRLHMRRGQYAQMQEAKRSPEAVLAQQLKKDEDVKALNRELRKEKATETKQERDPIPDRVEQLIPDSIPMTSGNDDEMNQAVQREAKEATERKRKADAEEQVKKAEAYLRLANLAKGKADSVSESPRKKILGFPIPSWRSPTV